MDTHEPRDRRGQRIILSLAGLWGLAGVIMLAAGSHPPRTGILATGGMFLLFHAAVVIGLIGSPLVAGWRRSLPIALMLLGSGLFAFEIGLHAMLGVSPLALLAPIGGGITVLGWLALAITPLLRDGDA
ncbi:hypothetical protein [Asticcacaulis sp. EMRT-3]|uniref:DUF423 domain-containing protein n=1 Tax=Asticcacaulis sp. EMRT-3 TaxID=3040349 RepID=UPI0024AF4C08|nr:hypothetical protein [Asticcacaulis sp. EMRT-3]MDI7773758.1 hypothetical protein [Asticcacaulis sp. EMRT-3]